jgi:FtsZ-binding cell division protein ZapB
MVEYWKDIAYLIGIFIAFITGNKTKKIDELSKYQAMYETFVAQYEKQYDSLKNTVDSLQLDINNLQLRNAIIIEESQNWKEKFRVLQRLYDKLKKEFDEYKINHK